MTEKRKLSPLEIEARKQTGNFNYVGDTRFDAAMLAAALRAASDPDWTDAEHRDALLAALADALEGKDGAWKVVVKRNGKTGRRSARESVYRASPIAVEIAERVEEAKLKGEKQDSVLKFYQKQLAQPGKEEASLSKVKQLLAEGRKAKARISTFLDSRKPRSGHEPKEQAHWPDSGESG